MDSGQVISTVGLGQALLDVRRGDLAAAKLLIGDVTAGTLAEVADAFNVAESTVSRTWRPQGMPGEAGRWPLAEILVWKIRREIAAGRMGVKGFPESEQAAIDRKRFADARKSEAEAASKELRNDVDAGGLLRRDVVEQALCELIVKVRESLLRLPREMMPRLPKKLAANLSAELERALTDKLTELADNRMSWEVEEGSQSAAAGEQAAHSPGSSDDI
jgi:phage terminase Nu1 subunit (DNA packaging protein)